MPAAAAPWTLRDRPKGLTFGGQFSTTVAPDLRMEGPYEDRFAWRNNLTFRVRHRFADDARYQIGARLRWNIRSGDRVEADLWLDLEPTWFQFRKDFLTLRAGLQVMKWGRNLLLSPTDILNPYDYSRALSTGEPGDARIPVLAAKATFNLDPVAIDVIWIPFFQPMRVAWYGQDFAVLRPGLIEEMLPSLVPQTGAGVVDDELRGAAGRLVDALSSMDAYQRDGLSSYLVADVPEELPWHGDVGARVGFSGRGVDADLYVLTYVVDQPAVTLNPAIREPLLEQRLPTTRELTILSNPGTELVSTEYHRSVMAAADVVVAGGGFVVSGEAAFRSHTVRYKQTAEPYLSPALQYAIAVRYSWSTTFAIDVEFGHDIILRPEADTLIHRPHNLQVALGGQLRLFSDRLTILLTGSYNLLRRDLFVHPRVTVEVAPRLALSFGVQVFEGFGADVEPNLDSFLSYEGGIPGYFRANDYAYGTIQVTY